MGQHNKFKYFNTKILSAPIMINLELTSGCDIKCRHCYNFWRDDSSSTKDKLTLNQMDELIDIIIRDKVFHVVLTGGEPLLNFNVLKHALERLHANNISTSVNSNLISTTPEKIKQLKDVGLDHILTSLNSYDSSTVDFMANKKGSFEKIINGIKIASDHGIRISVNMIISDVNKNHVYKTAQFCSEIGAQRIFATRLVPSINVDNPDETVFHLDKDGALSAIDDLLKAHSDFGIGIGTLISYPLCLLGDLNKYKDFVGRGCPAQRGNRMVINANGETHACTHESKNYGNVFDIGIKEAFRRMIKWHDGTYLYSECEKCKYINVCGSGCRSAANSYFKRMDERDPLFIGKDAIKIPYEISIPKEIIQAVDSGNSFIVPNRIRFREENGFYTINVRWANAFTITNELADFLIQKQKDKGHINVNNMMGNDGKKTLIQLIHKEALVPEDSNLREHFENGVKLGCSVNPEDIP